MFQVFLLLLSSVLFSIEGKASFDFGLGSSSFTAGRPVPALALGYDGDSWGAMYRSVGVQTPIYAQNAWTVAGHRYKLKENFGSIQGSISAGLGASYMVRAFRDSPTAEVESTKEYIFGPHFSLKLQWGYAYFGFDTLLGLHPQIQQHILLNFQDMSHVTVGMSL